MPNNHNNGNHNGWNNPNNPNYRPPIVPDPDPAPAPGPGINAEIDDCNMVITTDGTGDISFEILGGTGDVISVDIGDGVWVDYDKTERIYTPVTNYIKIRFINGAVYATIISGQAVQKERVIEIEMNGTIDYGGSIDGIAESFISCTNLTKFTGTNLLNLQDITQTFDGCTNLVEVIFSQVGVSVNLMMGFCFRNCTNLTYISEMPAGSIYNSNYMFEGCVNLVCLGNLNTTALSSDSIDMFLNCNSLVAPDVGEQTLLSEANGYDYTNSNSCPAAASEFYFNGALMNEVYVNGVLMSEVYMNGTKVYG